MVLNDIILTVLKVVSKSHLITYRPVTMQVWNIITVIPFNFSISSSFSILIVTAVEADPWDATETLSAMETLSAREALSVVDTLSIPDELSPAERLSDSSWVLLGRSSWRQIVVCSFCGWGIELIRSPAPLSCKIFTWMNMKVSMQGYQKRPSTVQYQWI